MPQQQLHLLSSETMDVSDIFVLSFRNLKLQNEIKSVLDETYRTSTLILVFFCGGGGDDSGEVEDDEEGLLSDFGWACVVILESLAPVMVDPVIGKSRLLFTPSVKEKAKDIAETWKKSLEERGRIENVKTPDVHTFLQHLVTSEDMGHDYREVCF